MLRISWGLGIGVALRCLRKGSHSDHWMKNFSIKKRVFLNFVAVISAFGIIGSVLGTILVNRMVVDEAQRGVKATLRAAWAMIQGKLDDILLTITLLGSGKRVQAAYQAPQDEQLRASLEATRLESSLDFLFLTDNRGRVLLRTTEPYFVGDDLSSDPMVSSALKGISAKGFWIMGAQRLKREGGDLEERAFMWFEETPKAKPRAKGFETSGMVMAAAAPVKDETGRVLGSICGGFLVNRNNVLVDFVRSAVFEEGLYRGKPIGTLTIFQWDVRVATNVILPNGNRALGTRVSADVYDKVLENGMSWFDKAFVVDDWYISAYDPIRDIQGKVIGILYVGLLYKKYEDIRNSLWVLFGALTLLTTGLVLLAGAVFARRLTGPLTNLARAATRIAKGDYGQRIPEPPSRDEIRELTVAFNFMSQSLQDREARLKEANANLKRINENYLNMLGFISHELKNTVGVIYTSALSLEKGFAGPLTSMQRELIGAITGAAQTCVSMIRNYLDLARIEHGELAVRFERIELVSEVLRPVLREMNEKITARTMVLKERLGDPIPLIGDRELLRVVIRNLLDNAIKYGRDHGLVEVSARLEGGVVRIEVYNEGQGLTHEQIQGLFRRFVRYEQSGQRKGTGLGLFITKEIVEKHGGKIWVESSYQQWVRFYIELPCKSETSTQDHPTKPL